MQMPLLKKLELRYKNLKNQFPKGQASGENIIINDSSNLEFDKFNILGNSKQEGAPSLENKADVKNCGDNINIIPTPENWEIGDISSQKNGTNIPSPTNDYIRTIGYFEIEPNTDYFINWEGKFRISFYEYDKDKTYIDRIKNSQILTPSKITTNKNARYIRIGLRYEDNFTTEKITTKVITDYKFKLEKGTVATPYSKYSEGNTNFKISNNLEQEQSISFPLGEGQVLHKEDFLGEDGIHQLRETLELTGTEDWYLAGGDSEHPYRYAFNTTRVKGLSDGLCSHFKNWYKDGNTNTYIEEGVGGNKTSTSISIYVKDETIGGNGVSYLKEWLSKQKENNTPLKIEYELAEEQIIPYTEAQRKVFNQLKELHTYKGTTHIFSEDEVSPVFEIEYSKDLETILEKG